MGKSKAKSSKQARDKLRQRIREAGLRCTMSRVAVLEKLEAARQPLSHADVAEMLVPHGFDKATIYRNLVELADAGLLARMELGDHVWRFESKTEGGEPAEVHPHFVCVDCGEVSCLPGVRVDVSPAGGSEIAIGKVTEVLLKGQCGRCV